MQSPRSLRPITCSLSACGDELEGYRQPPRCTTDNHASTSISNPPTKDHPWHSPSKPLVLPPIQSSFFTPVKAFLAPPYLHLTSIPCLPFHPFYPDCIALPSAPRQAPHSYAHYLVCFMGCCFSDSHKMCKQLPLARNQRQSGRRRERITTLVGDVRYQQASRCVLDWASKQGSGACPQ